MRIMVEKSGKKSWKKNVAKLKEKAFFMVDKENKKFFFVFKKTFP